MGGAILIGLAMSVLSVATSASAAAETCSEQRAKCLAGEQSRGYTPPPGRVSGCLVAYPVCLKTGVWHPDGRYGRRFEGMTRR